jgi:hypothetical protein
MRAEREFGADPDLKKLYRVYLALVLVCVFLWWMIPLVTFLFFLQVWIGTVSALAFFVPLLIAFVVVSYWIPKFHSSIKYVLTDEEIVVTKGVWWKTKSVVPYNRVTNINTYQGPISRRLGLGKLSIQTAGFSGVGRSGYRTAEAEIVGRKDFEDVKNVVMGFVKGQRPVAVEAEAEAKPSKDVNEQILQELRRIRESLEK